MQQLSSKLAPALSLALLLAIPGISLALPTSTVLTSSPNPSVFGQPVTLTATLSDPNGYGITTFYDGTTVLGSVDMSQGKAVLTTALIGSGVRALKAMYTDLGCCPPSISPPLMQINSPQPASGFYGASNNDLEEEGYPVAIAVADFNGDGSLDVAVADSLNDQLVVWLGDGTGNFSSMTTYDIGGSPVALAVGDFNGDGLPDLAVATPTSIKVLLGTDGGGFSVPTAFATATNASSIAVGDFDGDGLADIVFADKGASRVSVLFGAGDGSFSGQINTGVGSGPVSLATGDFNGDGKVDVVTANYNEGTVSVLTGRGTGHFSSNTYNLGAIPVTSVAVADLNGDTYPDIVFVRSNATMIVMLGSQSGDFSPEDSITLSNAPNSVTLGDIDGDGKVDVAVAEQNGNIEVWYGDGTGSFLVSDRYAVDQNPMAVAIEDFNGDGRADLVSANRGGNDFSYLAAFPRATTTETTLTSSLNPSTLGQNVTLTASVFPYSNQGTVNFMQGLSLIAVVTPIAGVAQTGLSGLPLGSTPYTAVYVDPIDIGSTSNTLNQQVNAIVATTTTLSATPNPSTLGASVTFSATISNLLATGTVIFMDGGTALNTANVTSGVASFSTSALTVGPHVITAVYSGDSGDLTSTSSSVTETINATVTLLTSSHTPIIYGHPVTLTASITPDTSTGHVTLYDGLNLLETLPLSGGSAAFTTPLLASGTRSLKAYYSGDVNETSSYSAPLSQVVTPVAGAGMFPQTPVATGTSPSSVVIADFTGDGIPDMAFLNTGDNTVSVLAGDGTGNFAATPVSLITLPNFVDSLAAGDFNGDGLMDLVVGTSLGFQVVLNSGSGVFGTPLSAVDSDWHDINSIAVADFNQDGIADVVVIDQDNSIIQLYLGTGNGLFNQHWIIGDNYNGPNDNGANPTTVAVGDFNGDGLADLAVIDNANNVVSVFLGDGAGNLGVQANFLVGNSPTSLAVADLNGDGKADIVVTNQSDNQVGVLLGDGTGSFASEVVYIANTSPTSISVADFNGDGHIDVAVANAQSELVSVLLGDGTGKLGAAMAYGSGYSNSIAVADLNGDGRADLVSVGSNNGLNQMVVLLAAVPTITTISSTPSTSVYGQSVTFSGTVSPTPIGGSVTLMDGPTVLNSGPVTDGSYSITVNSIVVGTRSITAVYSGDQFSPTGVSPVPAVQVVTALDSTTTLSSSTNPSYFQQSVTLTATVSSTLATGTVSFYEDSDSPFASSPVSGGSATYQSNSLSVGSHTITATYNGDSNVNGSTSTALIQSVGAVTATTTSLTSTPNPSGRGQMIAFTATVSDPLAGGIMTFMDGSNLITSVNVSAGSAQFNDFNMQPGKHAVTAIYIGDLADSPSTSAVYYQLVAPAVITLSSSAPSVIYGHQLTLTATVNGDSPTGQVTFYDGTTILETVPVSNGQAVLMTAALASGTRSLTAYYIGDTSNGPNGSAPLTQTVTPIAESNMNAFSQISARPNPVSLTMGDYSGDGIADLAFVHNGVGSISVLIGDGVGSFSGINASTVTYEVPQLLIASGDFNGDGLMDLAVITDNGLYTVLSTGGGNFASPSALVTTNLTVSSITTGDFNGDGQDDVILTDAAHGKVQVFLGDGTGLFTAGWSCTDEDSSPVAVAVGDFNHDGIPDIAVLNATSGDPGGNEVSVMLARGDGTFGAPVNFAVGNYPISIVAADFMGQGQTDLVVVNQGDNTISLLVGSGTGTFLPQTTFAAPYSPQSIVAADFNADGYPDVAVVNSDSDSPHALVSILLNDQAGHFGAPIGYGAGPSTAIAVGDFNGDGKADLVTLGRPNGVADVSVLLGTAATTTTIGSTPNPSTSGQSVTFSGSVSPASVAGTVTLMDGDNFLTTGPVNGGTYSISWSSLSVGLHSITAVYGGDSGDLSSTSLPVSQIVYGASSTTTALSSSANPSSFNQSVTITATVSSVLATGTVTFYDGLAPLGTTNVTGGVATFTTSTLAVATHSITADYSGDTIFGPSAAPALSQIVIAPILTTTTLLSSQNPSEIGHVVVLTASVSPNGATGSIAFMDGATLLATVNLTNGTATFSTSTFALDTHSLTAVYSGNLTSESSTSPVLIQNVLPGTPVTLTAPSPSSPYGQLVTLTAMVGTVGAQGKITFFDGTAILGTETMANQSASLPVLLASGTRSLTALYEGSQNVNPPGSSALLTHTVIALPGAGMFPQIPLATGTSPSSVVIADFTGDGIADMAFLNTGDKTISVLAGDGTGSFAATPVSLIPVPNTVESLAAGDFNGDGLMDLAAGTSSGFQVVLNSGSGVFGQPQSAVGTDVNDVNSIAVADFNQDGIPDIVVIGQDHRITQVYLGIGDGSFSVGWKAYDNYNEANPTTVAVGDFNGDGIADLAVLDNGNNVVSVMLGVGDGTFGAQSNFHVGNGPTSLVIADVNEDGRADLVVTNQFGNQVSVLLGDGTGAFAPQTTYAAGNSPTSIMVGDFNGDGHIDVAVANMQSDLVSVLLGDGTGKLGTAISYGVGFSNSIAVADFNRDGRADLVSVGNTAGADQMVILLAGVPTTTTISSTPGTSIYGQTVTVSGTVSPTPIGGTVTVMDGLTVLNSGTVVNGNYSVNVNSIVVGTRSITAVFSGESLSVGSVSNPTVQVVTALGSTTTLTSFPNPSIAGQSVAFTATVSTALATGTVSFNDNNTLIGSAPVSAGIGTATYQTVSLAPGPHSITATYNTDGNVSSSTSTPVSQVVGASTATTTTLLSSQNPSALGHVVVMTASVSPTGATGSIAFMDGATLLSTVNLINGTATFSTSTLALNTHSLTAVYSGDVSNVTSTSSNLIQNVLAGTPVTLSAPSPSSPYGQLVTLTATVGTAGAQGKITFYDGPAVLGTKMMTNQSALFPVLLASGTRSLTALYEGSQNVNAPGSSAVLTHIVTALPGAGFSAAPASYTTGNLPWALVTADLNGDGHPDMVVTNKSDNTVSVFIAGIDGTFLNGVPYVVGNSPISAAVADFNGDGFPDLVVANQTDNTVSVLLGTGTGVFGGQTTYTTGDGGSPSFVVVGDFNRDGVPDLAVTNQDTANVVVLLGVGDGTFVSPVPYSVGAQPASLAVGYFNNDGYADLAVVNQQDNNASVLLGNGDGTFQTAVNYPVGNSPIAIVVADFNNDGFADLAVANNGVGDNRVSLLLGTGSGTFGAQVTYNVENSPSNLAVGDFNGDGFPDIAVSSTTTSAVAVLLSNNAAFGNTYSYSTQGALQGLVVADFNGDGITDLAGTDSSGGLLVLTGLAPTGMTLSSSLNPSTVGQAVTLTATVIPAPVSGTVQFVDSSNSINNGILGTQALVNGTAVLTVSNLAAGIHSIGASYSGSSTQGGSNSLISQVVNAAGAAPTTTLLTSSQTSSLFGQTVTFTATVSGSATGTVQFMDGSTVLGSATLNSQVAVLSWSALAVGSHSLTATYSGDENNMGSTSLPLTQTITPANPCGITAEPAIFADSVGGSQTLTVTSTQPSCSWEVSTSTPWIELSASSGTGSGTVTVTVAPQTVPAVARTGAIQLGAQSILVTQRITPVTFTDVPPSAPYFDPVNMLFTNHITEGCSGDPVEYCPTAEIPRWEMAVLIVRAIYGGDSFPSAGTNPYFNDVQPSDPGFAWIQKLAQLGITTGCGNGNFCPAQFVPRDEMAVFMMRTRYGVTAVFDFPPVAYFADVTPLSFGWSSIQRMREDSITSGCAPTLFCPMDLVTRSDMAAFIMRAEFNQFLPLNTPVISTVSPAVITHGTTATYTIVGLNTGFVQGITDLAPMLGITVTSITVNSSTVMTVSLTAASDAALQPVSLVAITGAPPGNEEAVLPNGLLIQ